MRKMLGVYRLNEFPSYKGGHTCLSGGYIYEFAPNEYPHLQNNWGWVAQHRMIGENILGRRLVQSKNPRIAEYVHHKDECRTNNSIDNLEVMTMSAHRSHHGKRNGEINRSAIDENKLIELLKTMGIKTAARELGVHHMTIRNRFPELIAHKKRRSPEKIDDPKIIETVLFFAPNANYAIYDVESLTNISARSILRICKKNGIKWVHKQRSGRPPKPSQKV